MAAAAPDRMPHRSRWRRRVLLALVIVTGLVIALPWLVPAEQVADLLLRQISPRLHLEITRSGPARWQLRGGPLLEIHSLTIRQRGADTPWLHAERVLLAAPWRTVRSLGKDPALTRVEIDAPTLDLPALREWLDKRPPGDGLVPWPSVSDGLVIGDGRIRGDGWQLEALALHLLHFTPDLPPRGVLSGHYTAADTRVGFDLGFAMNRPFPPAGAAIVGTLEIQQPGINIPLTVTLSGPLRFNQWYMHIPTLRLAVDGQFSRANLPSLPFALTLTGALELSDLATLSPFTLDLTGSGPLPSLHATGRATLGEQISIHLAGHLPHWPTAWPGLPPPLHRLRHPLGFTLDYTGAMDLSGQVAFHLQRDATRLTATVPPSQLLEWFNTGAARPTLPPLQGRLTTPTLELPGLILHGVEVKID